MEQSANGPHTAGLVCLFGFIHFQLNIISLFI